MRDRIWQEVKMSSAIFVEKSKNIKITGGEYKISATYTSIKASCPNDCKLKNTTCYAQVGKVAMHESRLEDSYTPEQVAREEANAIDSSYNGGTIPQDGYKGGRDLRLHVSGDARTRKAARILSAAARRYVARNGGAVYSYTHAWRRVPRSMWKGVSVLASIENAREAKQARKMGYAPAIVVAPASEGWNNNTGEQAFPNGAKAFYLEGSNTKWIPCPSITKDIPCVKCRLCMNADKLFAINAGIAFVAHGARRRGILKVIQG